MVQYVLLYIYENCDPVNKIYYCNLFDLPNGLQGRKGRDLLPFVKLVDNFDASYQYIANDNTEFTFLTNKDAQKYRLIRLDLEEPSTKVEVLKEAESEVLESVVAVNGNQILVTYLSDVKHVLQLRDLRTGTLLHHLPIDIGTVYNVSARRKDITLFIGFTSFLTPGVIYQCNLESGIPDLRIFREILVSKFDRTEFQVNQVTSFKRYLLNSFFTWQQRTTWPALLLIFLMFGCQCLNGRTTFNCIAYDFILSNTPCHSINSPSSNPMFHLP